ncbi:MAG: hypothetical protein H0X38_04435 [Planctomycetes bacterium]|nr:hypothetical protein [Planctomycetota bacterium]
MSCPAAALLLLLTALLRGGPLAAVEPPLDTLAFGVVADEQRHHLVDVRSEIIRGGADQPARRLLPNAPAAWDGGTLAFTLACDGTRQTYVTATFWGGDAGEELGRLTLFCAGKQVGYRHLGDVDQLDIAGDEPACPGRFFHVTLPLPAALTAGQQQVALEIRASGRIWGYGTNWEQYQKPLAQPTRGIYRIASHTDPCFTPPADLPAPVATTPPLRQAPGAEVMDQLKQRVDAELAKQLRDAHPPGQLAMQFLAEGWHVAWCSAFQRPAVVERVCAGGDELYRRFRADAKIAEADPQVYNAEWLGLGPAGNAIRLLHAPLAGHLDETFDDGAGGHPVRRAAWAQMLRASVEWHRRHRRQYTNQSMINDLYLYLANRGVAALDPAQALPEAAARRYLYESLGLQPWLGSDNDQGGERPLGDHYLQITAKGLTRELGYVGYYGEVLDWAAHIFNATREPGTGRDGDPRLQAQLQKLTAARALFRYPALDADGNRAMRIETVVGWRDTHYPGDVTYGERAGWEGSALYAAASAPDAAAIGIAQQLFADHQFFRTVADEMKEKSLRVTRTLLHIPDEYAALSALPPSALRLPMTPGQGDVAWSDEEDGVVAVHHGAEVFYASLYWRARYAVNFLARVHLVDPRGERIATVREDVRFTPDGHDYTRPDWVNMGFGNGGLRYPGDLHSAFAGEKQPIALVPPGDRFSPGQEHPAAGKGDFYVLRYGDYLISMNCTVGKSFALPAPAGVASAPELISATIVSFEKPLVVGPRSTVILYLGKAAAP